VVLGAAATEIRADRGFRVVVHTSNPVATITRQELSDLFLKKATKWDSGDRAVPVDQSKHSLCREPFSRDVHGRSVNAINWYWRRMVFSGTTRVPPLILDHDGQVLEFVASNTTAVGYVSDAVELEGHDVKILEVRD
jgi:ABC-type phosphate transport system substrate-binding protein